MVTVMSRVRQSLSHGNSLALGERDAYARRERACSKPAMVARATLVEAGRGVAFRLALIALLVMTMLVLTLLNVSAVERIVSGDTQDIVPARRAILSTDPAGLSSSNDSSRLPLGQLGNGGCEE